LKRQCVQYMSFDDHKNHVYIFAIFAIVEKEVDWNKRSECLGRERGGIFRFTVLDRSEPSCSLWRPASSTNHTRFSAARYR